MAWAPDYGTLAQARRYVRIGDNADDDELTDISSAASRAIDGACHRQFGVVAAVEARVYTAVWDRHIDRWVVVVDDVATTTGAILVVDGTTVTDYTLEPRNAVAKGKVWTQIVLGTTVTCTGDRDGVTATMLWGWPTVPVPVRAAWKMQVSRFLARRDAPFGVAGSPSDGSEVRLLARLDPDVAVILGPYVRLV